MYIIFVPATKIGRNITKHFKLLFFKIHFHLDTYYINNDYNDLWSLWRLYTSNSEQIENTKSAERQKTGFPKELVKNTNFYKPLYIEYIYIY